MPKINKITYIITITQSILVILLISLVLFIIVIINSMQGNARVINYAGIVRGASQRVVKLEISQQHNYAVIFYLDSILADLQNGGGPYHLIKLQNEDYQTKLAEQAKAWEILKKEITKTQMYGFKNTDIMELSESYYNMANDTVSAAEEYSEGKALQLKQIEVLLFIVISSILVLLLMQTVSAIKLRNKNRELNKIVYIDVNTGLPNKGKCEQLFLEHGILSKRQEFAGIMFDLNNLKMVNDTFGHKAGDALILNFAGILKRYASDKVFIGRYGGDEFVAVLFDTNEKEVLTFLNNLAVSIHEFNITNNEVEISYAFGYELSGPYSNCTLQNLIDKADKKMYIHKSLIKKNLCV